MLACLGANREAMRCNMPQNPAGWTKETPRGVQGQAEATWLWTGTDLHEIRCIDCIELIHAHSNYENVLPDRLI